MSTSNPQPNTVRQFGDERPLNPVASNRRAIRRQLSLPVLAGTVAIGLILVVAGYFWRQHQVSSLSSSLLDRVAQLEAEKEWALAVGYLQRYAILNPEDEETHIRAAKAFDHDLQTTRQKEEAVQLYYRAIGIDPADSSLRRRQAELLYEIGRLAGAKDNAQKLLAESATKDDPVAQRIVALVSYKDAVLRDDTTTVKNAVAALTAANAMRPSDVQIAYNLAMLYRTKHEKMGIAAAQANKLADEIIAKMVDTDPSQAEAWLVRAQYRQEVNQPDVDKDLEQAVKLGPTNREILIVAGEHAMRFPPGSPNLDRAAELFKRAIDIAPTLDRGYIGLALVERARGDNKAASATLDNGRKRVPVVTGIDLQLFELQLTAREIAKAQQTLARLKEDAEVQGLSQTALERLARRLLLARLEAQWLLANNQPALVPPLINKTIVNSGALGESMFRNPDLARCRLLLAQAYSQLDNWELAAAEFSEVAAAIAVPTEFTLAACEAWKRAGKFDEAIESYERAVRTANAAPAFWIGLVQTHFEKQFRNPSPGTRDWQPFLGALAKAREAVSKSSELRFIEADYLLAQNSPAQRDQAIALLRSGEKDFATDRNYWRRLVIGYERLKLHSEADRALKQFISLTPDKLSVAIVQADLLAMRNQISAAQTLLAETAAQTPANLRRPLTAYQIQLALQSGDLAAARQHLATLRNEEPNKLVFQRSAAELAFEARDWPALAELEEPLRNAEGDSGHLWRFYRAARLIGTSKQGNSNAINEADGLIQSVLKQRPNWTPAIILSGQLAEARGDFDRAVASYTSAIDAGDRRISTYERLLSLLYRLNRFADAQQIFDKIGKAAQSSDRLEALAMLTAAQRDQPARALEMARQSAEHQPNDAMRQVWLAEMQQLNGQRSEAIATLQRAVSLAKEDVRTWNSVFMYHVRGNDLVKAEKTLLELVKYVKLEPAQRSFILGQGFELLGKRSDALTAYRQATALAPKDVAILSRLAGLQLQDDVEAAETTLRQIIAIAPENIRARQALATMLALRDHDGAWDEAQQLLKQATTEGGVLPADERLRAVLLVRRGGDKQRRIAQHADAREILKTRIGEDGSIAAADRMLLAGIYESEAKLLSDPSKLEAAREQLQKLVEVADAKPSHLSMYADFLMRHTAKVGATPKIALSSELRDSFLSEAERCIDRIDEALRKPDRYPSPQSIGLRARLLSSQGRNDQIEKLIEPLAERQIASLKKETEQNQWMLDIGNIYTSLENHAAAQRWFERLWKAAPPAYAPLVTCLVAQGKFSEAVSVCEGVKKQQENLPRAAQVLAAALASGKPNKDDLAKAEPIIAQAVKSHPGDLNLLFSVAVLRAAAEQPAEAIELFERVVKAAPKNLLALNNLATLLAEQPQRQGDALQYIEQAIQVAGRKPALLDTQGTIYLIQGNLTAAAQALEEAVNSEATDPRYPFHLAAVYAKLGRKEDARTNYERAKQDGLDDHVLTAGDLELRKLLENLN